MLSSANTAEMRRLSSLAWPIMLASLQWMLLNAIDTIMVGHAGALELAYVNVGRILTWTAWNIAFGLLSGIVVFAARADGAGEQQNCGDVLRQGIVYGLTIATGLGLLLVFASRPLMEMLEIPADQLDGGVFFTQIMAGAMFIRLVSMPVTYFLEGISRPRVAMILALMTLPLNAFFNWILIFGKFGAPAMGAAGAALGTLLAVLAETIALWIYITRFREREKYGLGGAWLGNWKNIWRRSRALRLFGLAPAFAAGMENIGFSLLGVLAAQLGTVTAAAFQSVLALYISALTAAIGFASATGVRVGNAVGERAFADIARRGWIAGGMTLLATCAFSVFLLLFPDTSLRLFSDDAQVIAMAKTLLLLLAPIILFDGLQIVLVYALRASGDPLFAGIIQAISFLIIMVGVAWVAIHPYGLAERGLAFGLIAGVLVSASLMSARFLWITRTGGSWIARKNPATLPT
jgi:multidrug resistance protein, MATE family